MGGLQTFAARHTNGSYAQKVYFAKSRQRPIAAAHVHLRMLQCGPSLRAFVHLAAFLLAETSVCGQTELAQPRLMPTQKFLAYAASLVCQRSLFRRTGHAIRLFVADYGLIVHCDLSQKSTR
jgi:hypothetical protein